MQPTSSSADRLSLLYELSQAFNSSLDLDEVLHRVMDEVIVAVRAERGFMMLDEGGEKPGEGLVFRVARGIDQKTIDTPQFEISRSVVEKVAADGQPILTSNAQDDERFSMRTSVMFLGLRSILCVPLRTKDRFLGVIYVDNRIQAGIFTQSDLELLSAIASSASIAIENARLYQVAVEKGRMERELQVARQVQASLLPQSVPQVEGWEFCAFWQPAREVAGDYYDFIMVKKHELGILIADVSGKGMPAALFMALTRNTLRASLAQAASPAAGISQANRILCSDSADGTFVTLFYAAVNLLSGKLTFVNAGHNPPLLYRASQGQVSLLSRTGMALGVDENGQYDQRAVTLVSGDMLLLYTDGVTETMDVQSREFGTDRLKEIFLKNRSAPVAQLTTELQDSIREHSATAIPFDDITLVCARRL